MSSECIKGKKLTVEYNKMKVKPISREFTAATNNHLKLHQLLLLHLIA